MLLSTPEKYRGSFIAIKKVVAYICL